MFLVAWTGGYEQPQYLGTNDHDEALRVFAEWANLTATDDGETVQVLQISEIKGDFGERVVQVEVLEEI